MRSIRASHCRWHRGIRRGGAQRHHESLSCVQLKPVASVSFLESASIRTRGQFEDGWVGIYASCEGLFFKRLLHFVGRGDTHINCLLVRMCTGIHIAHCQRWWLASVDVKKVKVVHLYRWIQCFARDEPSYTFWRFVVYLLPTERCFLSNFLF